MEALFIYLLKSSALLALFYLAYHFLVRKETFFDSNRWFLLSGLFTSLLLPLFIIRKTILVERPKMATGDLLAYSQQPTTTIQNVHAVEAFDWIQFIWVSYLIITLVLVIRIVLNLSSLYRMLHKQQVIKIEAFKLVNLNENIAPFSFFEYIVFNSSLYTETELQNILWHEKIHSREKHSLDILIAEIYACVFWFNPFIWFYKKAITQNLEYIADQKAVEHIEDRKAYQKTLVKVVSHQNCLTLTNPFYQSLIKKRIVMLNKNQSHKRNSWKYALVIPALIAFVFLFQVKVTAQEKEEVFAIKSQSTNEVQVVIHKNSTDAEMKKEAALLKEQYGVTLKCSKVKRNSSGEITCIKVEFKDKEGNKGVSQVNTKEPIKPILFFKNDKGIGLGSPRRDRSYTTRIRRDEERALADRNDSIYTGPTIDIAFDTEAPESPEAIELAEIPEAPEAPEAFAQLDDNTSSIIIKKGNGKKPLVMINGKVISDEKEIDEALQKYDVKGNGRRLLTSDGEEAQVIVNGMDVMKLRDEAMEKAQVELRRMRPQIRNQVRSDIRRAKKDAERAQIEIKNSEPDLQKARAEMNQAREEMLKAKAEMDAAKAEFEKAKAEMKKKK